MTVKGPGIFTVGTNGNLTMIGDTFDATSALVVDGTLNARKGGNFIDGGLTVSATTVAYAQQSKPAT